MTDGIWLASQSTANRLLAEGIGGADSADTERRHQMVSTWWLLLALLAGGSLGFLLFALLAMAGYSDGMRNIKVAHSRATHIVKEGVLPG